MTLPIATALLTAGLALVALAFVLVSRRYSGKALAAGLVGLLALTTASTWLTFAGTRTATPPGADTRDAEIAILTAKLRQADERLGQADTEIARLGKLAEQELAEHKGRVASLEARLAEAERRATPPVATTGAVSGGGTPPALPPPAGSGADAGTVARLEADLAATRASLGKAEEQMRAAAAQSEQLAREVEAQKAAALAAQQGAGRAVKEAKDAKEAAARAAKEAQDKAAQLSRAQDEIKMLRQAAAQQPAPQPAPPPRTAAGETPRAGVAVGPVAAPPAVVATTRDDLRRKIAAPIATRAYSVVPLRAQELVAGQRGSWYAVRLRERDGRPLTFANRRFSKPEAAADIAESMRRLHDEVLAPAAAGGTVRLYLRGSADPRGYTGRDEVPAPGHAVSFLTRRSDGTYRNEMSVRAAGRFVRNADLPNLRADWVREQLRQVQIMPQLSDIEILDNAPSRTGERTVELIVFVEW